MKKIVLMLLPLLMGGSAYAQCVIKAELKDVTGGYTPHWTDAEGKIHPGVKPQSSTPLV